MLTNPHRPYGKNRVSLEEIKRVRAAGGWVCFLILLALVSRGDEFYPTIM